MLFAWALDIFISVIGTLLGTGCRNTNSKFVYTSPQNDTTSRRIEYRWRSEDVDYIFDDWNIHVHLGGGFDQN